MSNNSSGRFILIEKVQSVHRKKPLNFTEIGTQCLPTIFKVTRKPAYWLEK